MLPAADRPRLPWWVAPALMAALVMTPSLLYPYGRDQAVFAYLGETIADGGMPYRNAWDLKPPGIYLAYALLALLSRLGGSLMVWVRAADLVAAAGTAVLIGALLRRWGRGEDAPVAAAWSAGLYLSGGYWAVAQAEAWANPAALGAALLCLAARDLDRKGPPLLVGAGFLAAVAALLKFTAVLPVLPFTAYAYWRGGRISMLCLLYAAAGASVPLAAVVLWLAAGGAWEPYLEIQRGFLAPYARLTAPDALQWLRQTLRGLAGWPLLASLPLLLSAAGFGLAGPPDEWRTRGRWLALSGLAAAVIAVCLQARFFFYHWQSAQPFLAMLAAVGATALLTRARVRGRAAVLVGLVLALGWTAAVRGSELLDAARCAAGALPRESWLRRFGSPGGGDYSYLASEWVAGYVREHTRPGDLVAVWGFEPGVYLLSDRRPPTRFFFNVPVAAPFAPEGWKREYLQDLRQEPPELFLVLHNDHIPGVNARPEDSAGQLAAWPDLAGWLRRHYRFETRIEDFSIYRIRDRRP